MTFLDVCKEVQLMKRFSREKLAIILISVFVIAAVLFMFGGNIFSGSGNNERQPERDYTVMPVATGMTDEITKGVKVEQSFVSSLDSITEIGIVFGRLYYVEDVDLMIELLSGNEVLASNTYNVKDIEDQHRTFLTLPAPLKGAQNKEFRLRIYPVDKSDTGLTIMMNDSEGKVFNFDKRNVKGTLCFSITE